MDVNVFMLRRCEGTIKSSVQSFTVVTDKSFSFFQGVAVKYLIISGRNKFAFFKKKFALFCLVLSFWVKLVLSCWWAVLNHPQEGCIRCDWAVHFQVWSRDLNCATFGYDPVYTAFSPRLPACPPHIVGTAPEDRCDDIVIFKYIIWLAKS